MWRAAAPERGFVLLIVLSALGLLAVVAASFTHIARTQVRTANDARESARAEALADAGVQLAVLDLVAARDNRAGERRFPLHAVPVMCSVPHEHAELAISVHDEAGKVDLNVGSEALIRALLLGAGVQAGEAAVDAVLDFRDTDDDRRPGGAERAEYIAAGRLDGPKNAPFQAVEELGSVLGITQADVDRLRPFVTIHSGQPAVDVNVAADTLVKVLVRGFEQGGRSFMEGGAATEALQLRGEAALPAAFLAASTRRAFSVRSEARTATGALFVREAVVEFTAPRAEAYVIRRWFRGTAGAGRPRDSRQQQGLPPC